MAHDGPPRNQFGDRSNAARLSAASRAVLTFLEEHPGWQEQEQVMLYAMPVVPPGVALRHNERQRLSSTRKNKSQITTRQRHLDESTLIASGQRSKVNESINSMVNNGRVERRMENGVRQLRIVRHTPRCLVVRENGETTVSVSQDVELIHVDGATLNELSLEELKELRQQVDLLPNRLVGRYNALGMINIAIRVKEHDGKLLG